MKAKSRLKEETLPAVRLFRNNLDDLIKLFSEHTSDVTVSDKEYFYSDFAEMRDKTGPRFRHPSAKWCPVSARGPTVICCQWPELPCRQAARPEHAQRIQSRVEGRPAIERQEAWALAGLLSFCSGKQMGPG